VTSRPGYESVTSRMKDRRAIHSAFSLGFICMGVSFAAIDTVSGRSEREDK
jgi:hypothetical protein